MTDTSTLSGKPPAANTKPRLSLFSTRQSGIRLRSSEEFPDKLDPLDISDSDHRNDPGLDATKTSDRDEATESSAHLAPSETEAAPNKIEAAELATDRRKNERSSQDGQFARLHQHLLGSGKQSGINIEDLFRIMTLLKSDIQTKEIALNSFKTEQLKRLINPIEIKKSTLANAYIELQDRIGNKKNANKGNSKPKQRSSSASDGTQSLIEPEKSNPSKLDSSDLSEKKRHSLDHIPEGGLGASESLADKQIDNFVLGDSEEDDENLHIMIALLELLDRHPLLALPRDAMYCLDYACNDISTKNYLNLKIQGLEDLIDQHRRFRYFMSERLKRSEQRYMELNLKLEMERRSRMEDEKSSYKSSGKAVLLDHIDQLKNALEKEKASKHAIVMTLLNELLDEREKSTALNERVIELEKKLASKVASSQSPLVSKNKPRVPAKPAQLLDRQRSQSKSSR